MRGRPLTRPEAHSLTGPARAAASLAHSAAVGAELALARAIDRAARPPADAGRLAQVTALVKTFERPATLRRLLASVERVLPGLHVVVVDDSRHPLRLPRVETVVLPYDTGVGAGRNEGLARITTPYVALLDDDFVLFRRTRLDLAAGVLERFAEVDLVGGTVVDLPLLRRRPVPRGAVFPTAARPLHALGSRIGGYEVVDKVPNFFVARREALERVRWDPALKRMEHADFFTRALGVLTTVHDPGLQVLHARTPFDAGYMASRLDLAADAETLRARYGG